MLQQKTKTIFLGLIALIGVAGAFLFPTQNLFQTFLAGIAFLIIFPYLTIKFILKESVKQYGLTFPPFNKKFFLQFGSLFLISLGLFFVLFAYTPLREHYFPPTFLSQRFFFFFLYSILVGGTFSLIFSAFFQGFLLFYFERLSKEWAILLQWFCFILFLFIAGDLEWNMTLYIYISLFSGALAYISRSFLTSFIFTWIFVILADMFLLKFF